MNTSWQPVFLERMVQAVEIVQERLLRATSALNEAGIPYAVVGGNAVATWVAKVDRAAVRNTQDVDLLLRRSDLEAATLPLEKVGFIRRHVKTIDMFLDGPDAKARDAVHIVFAGEKVRSEYLLPTPDVTESETTGPFQVITLPALVRMKLTSFRNKDKMHLLDLLDVELIDAGWVDTLPPELGARLQELIDNPEG
jgi:hypothetical protein